MKSHSSSKSASYDISVIIVCRNGEKVTEACLLSLLPYPVKEVIIVDNASEDGTLAMLNRISKKDKRVNIIKNNINNGFAGANNQGARLATGSYIFFLNNDTLLTENIFPTLLKSLNVSQIAAVQPMIVFPNGTIDSVGSYMTPTGFLYHRAHRIKPNKRFLNNDVVYSMKGAAMIWKKAVLDEIGFLDESYFAYFEETELCHRAMNAGYQVAVVPSVKITHLGGFTSNTMDTEFIQYYNTKNRLTTYARHFSIYHLMTILSIHLVLTELLMLKLLCTGSWKIALSVQRGIIQGCVDGMHSRIAVRNATRNLLSVTKKPDLQYYLALFSSLEGYLKIW